MKVLLYTCVYSISLKVLRPTFFNIYDGSFSHSPNIQISGKIMVKVGAKTNYFSSFMSSCTNRFTIFHNFFPLTCSQPRDKQNHACGVLLFKYFLINPLLTAFMQNVLTKLANLLGKKWIIHCHKKRGYSFVQQSVRNVCAKLKVDCLSCFCIGARQVFTIQKSFPMEIPITMITATSNSI